MKHLMLLFIWNLWICYLVSCHFAVVINGCDGTFFMLFDAIDIRWAREWRCLNAKETARYSASWSVAWINSVIHIWLKLKIETENKVHFTSVKWFWFWSLLCLAGTLRLFVECHLVQRHPLHMHNSERHHIQPYTVDFSMHSIALVVVCNI